METLVKKSTRGRKKAVVIKPEIDDAQNRDVLSEGRNYGMGFGFLKHMGENKYVTVQPISPCKDYLNDVVWSEAVNRTVRAYGLSYKKQDIFTEEFTYMAIKICKRFGGREYAGYVQDVQRLKDNYKNLEKLINIIEESLKLEQRSEITETGDNMYLVKMPKFWVQYTYLISLYSLLLRTGIYWDGTTEVFEYLRKFKDFNPDIYLLSGAMKKLDKLVGGTRPVQNMDGFSGGADVHNYGIAAMNF